MSELRGLDPWMKTLYEQELPTLNTVVKEICALSENEKTRAEDLTRIILRDADLTSKVLKIANSIHYNPSFSPIKTVSRGIVQLGFENLKNITLATTLIDNFLKGKPKELMVKTLARSFHAAVQAKAMVPHLSGEKKEQVFIAALLYNLGELALIATGRKQVEDFIQARNDAPGHERELSQEFLGVDVHQLTRQLLKDWSLGELLVDSEENTGPTSDAVRAIQLGNDISKHIHKGMRDPDMQRLCEKTADLCKLKPEDAKKQLMMVADEASVIAKTYGASQLISALPDPNLIDTDEKPLLVKPDFYFQHQLNHIHQLMASGEDISKITQVSLNALHNGADVSRLAIALVDYKTKSLDIRYVAGKGTHIWRQQIHINLEALHKGELLHDFLVRQKPMWYQPDTYKQDLGVLEIFNVQSDLFLAPLFLNKRLVALMYADNAGTRFTPRQFEEFQLIANQLNLMMRINSAMQ